MTAQKVAMKCVNCKKDFEMMFDPERHSKHNFCPTCAGKKQQYIRKAAELKRSRK